MDFFKKHLSLWFKALIFMICSSSLYGAERISLKKMSLGDLQKLMVIPRIDAQSQHDLSSSSDLSVIERHTDRHQIEHVRMQQQYAGLPVMGGYAIFHQNRSKDISDSVTMNGTLYQKLQQDLGERPPELLLKSKAVLMSFSQQFPASQITDKQINPIIYVDESHRAYWAYQVSVFLQPQEGMPSRPVAIVDAKDGHVFISWNDLSTVRYMVHGLGFGGNNKMGRYQYGKDFPFLTLIRDEDAGQCFLENGDVRVVDMQHHTQHPNTAMGFDCEDALENDQYWTGYDKDGYDRINGGYSVANDAMYMGGIVKEMYRNQYHQEVLYAGRRPMQLILRVHYSTHFANAFWDGRQMTFGDGDGAFHPMVSLGIAAHEISHGFTQQHSGLIYYGQSGGINESFSDMAAQAAEFYAYGQSSWLIGADILKGRGALRFMKKPSRDGLSIDRADQYQKGMDVHYSSGVYNNLFYILANRPNWNTMKAFQVMIKANVDYWTPNTTFEEGACGILSATHDLGFEEEDVMVALDEVNIDYFDC